MKCAVTIRRQVFWCVAISMLTINAWIATVSLAKDLIYAGRFSSVHSDGALPDAWQPLTFANMSSHTEYSLVEDNGTQVVKATSNASASGLIRRIKIDPEQYPILQWRWKVLNIIEQGDVTKKEGDDYAARIYITFEYDPKRAGFYEKAMAKLGRLVYGESPPTSTVNYIWANKALVGTIIQSPFTKLDKMIVVKSGEKLLNHWITEERNIYDDYVMAFGQKPPMISGVAIMTDSDNTKESVVAFYGDIIFKRQ